MQPRAACWRVIDCLTRPYPAPAIRNAAPPQTLRSRKSRLAKRMRRSPVNPAGSRALIKLIREVENRGSRIALASRAGCNPRIRSNRSSAGSEVGQQVRSQNTLVVRLQTSFPPATRQWVHHLVSTLRVPCQAECSKHRALLQRGAPCPNVGSIQVT
ncbi:unnamed protein product [Lota lota]